MLWEDVARGMVMALVCAGCGFQGVSTDVPDLSPLVQNDLAGADFAGVVFDLTALPDLVKMVGGTGPGPLGALPPGFCCNANEECRSRLCGTESGVSFCTEVCDTDDVCKAWGGAFLCDPGNGSCLPTNPTNPICVPAAQYSYGTKPIGTCCQHGFAKSGQECLGGRCVTTGNSSNPFYCSQGCNGNTPCPGGYSCFGGLCWISGTVGNDNFTYSCQ